MGWSSGRKPHGVVKDQERLALQNRNNAPGTWPESSRSKPPFREGNPIQRNSAGQPQATAPATTPTTNPFGDEHSIDNWKCTSCGAQGTTTPERVENLKRNGRYYFECEKPNCGVTLVAKQKKDSVIVKVEKFQQPPGPTIHARAKEGWIKSKDYVRRTGRAVKSGLARLTGSKSDTATSGSDKATARRPSEASFESIPQSDNTHTAPSKSRTVNPFSSNHSLDMTMAQSQKHVTQQTQATDRKLNLRCPSCPERFPSFESLRQHVASCHRGQGGSRPGKMTGKWIVGSSVSEDADKKHREEDFLFYKCRIAGCERTFDTEEQLLKHQAEKHPGRDDAFFLCGICEASFVDEASWREHERTAHPVE